MVLSLILLLMLNAMKLSTHQERLVCEIFTIMHDDCLICIAHVSADAKFETLCSYQVSTNGQTVGLMCVALNGFHCAKCTYSWSRDVDGKPIPDESYPVIYSTTAGKYVCMVAVDG